MKVLVLSLLFCSSVFALSEKETMDIVKEVDENQRNTGDYKSLIYMEQKEKEKDTAVYEAVVYRRDEEDKWMILFTKPKTEAGKGYLRIDKNLLIYEPSTGRWERRTERTRLGGTSSRRDDLDESRLVEEYDSKYLGEAKLGKMEVWHFELLQKEGKEVSVPKIQLWVDQKTKNVLKRQEFALSGKLLRTLYYPKWEKRYSESKKSDVYVPKEIRMIDEVEVGSSTIILLKEFSLSPLPPEIFTKAWLESQSR